MYPIFNLLKGGYILIISILSPNSAWLDEVDAVDWRHEGACYRDPLLHTMLTNSKGFRGFRGLGVQGLVQFGEFGGLAAPVI